jgi:hypothetical protein
MIRRVGLQENSRVNRLDSVLEKALDVSGSVFDDTVLSECFGSIKTQFGTSMSRLFQNMLVKLKSNMKSSYQDICIRRDLDDRLLALENVKYADTGNASTTTTINSSQEQLKLMEIEHLKAAIKEIEVEIANLKNHAGKVKTSIMEEIATINDSQLTRLR